MWVAVGLYLVFFGLCLVAWVLSRLVATLHDIEDTVRENVVLDGHGIPVVATEKAVWDA